MEGSRCGPSTKPQAELSLTHVEEVFRAEYGRVVAGLVRRFGDIDLAEDALADALVTALERGHAMAYRRIRQPG